MDTERRNEGNNSGEWASTILIEKRNPFHIPTRTWDWIGNPMFVITETTPVELRTGGEPEGSVPPLQAKFTINGVGSSISGILARTKPMQPIHIVFVPGSEKIPGNVIPFSASTTAVQERFVSVNGTMLSNYPGYIIVTSNGGEWKYGFMRAYRPTQNFYKGLQKRGAPLLESAPADYMSAASEGYPELAPNGKLPAPTVEFANFGDNVDNPVTEYITSYIERSPDSQSSGHEEMSISDPSTTEVDLNRFHYLRSLFESIGVTGIETGEGVTINHGLMREIEYDLPFDAIDYFKGGALTQILRISSISKIGGQASATIASEFAAIGSRWLIRYRYIVDVIKSVDVQSPDCLDYLPVSITGRIATTQSSVTNTLVDAPRWSNSHTSLNCGFIAAPYDKPVSLNFMAPSADGKGKTRVLREGSVVIDTDYPEVPKTSDVEASPYCWFTPSNPKENGMATFKFVSATSLRILLAAVVSTENTNPSVSGDNLVRLDRGLFDYKMLPLNKVDPLPKQWLYAYPFETRLAHGVSNTDWSLTDNPTTYEFETTFDFGMASELKRHNLERGYIGHIDVPDAGLVAGNMITDALYSRAEPIVDTEGIVARLQEFVKTPNGLRHYLYVIRFTIYDGDFAVGASDKNTKWKQHCLAFRAECNDSAKAAAEIIGAGITEAGYLEATVKEGSGKLRIWVRGGGAVSVYLDGTGMGDLSVVNLLAKTWVRCDSGFEVAVPETDYGAQIGLTTNRMERTWQNAVINTGAGIDFTVSGSIDLQTTPMFQWFSPDTLAVTDLNYFYLLNGARKEGSVTDFAAVRGKTWTVGSTRTNDLSKRLDVVAAALANAKEDRYSTNLNGLSDNRGVTPNVLHHNFADLQIPTASQTVPGIADKPLSDALAEAVTGLSDKGHSRTLTKKDLGLDLADNTADVDLSSYVRKTTLLNNQPMDTGPSDVVKGQAVTPASLLPYEGKVTAKPATTSEPGVVTLTDKSGVNGITFTGKGSKADPVTGQQDPGTGGGTVDPDDNKLYIMDKLTLNGTTLLTTTALMGYTVH
ncbi:hypothetical protein SPFM12_00112 [Salmonella phage SPFM12]|nr:hypothetical protein SPFM12_00112 [Salmonella phage SPFM12]